MTKKILNTVLKDNGTFYGGVSRDGETLGEFIEEVGLTVKSTFEEIDSKLEECGIEQVFGTQPMYINVEDRQGTTWAVGLELTLNGWRELAMEWADLDGNDGIIEELENLPHNEKIIDFINEFWDIRIVPSLTLSKKELKELRDFRSEH